MPLSFLSGINSCTKIKTISSSFFVLKNLFDTIKKVLFGQKKKKTAQPLNVNAEFYTGKVNLTCYSAKKKKKEHNVCFNESGHRWIIIMWSHINLDRWSKIGL